MQGMMAITILNKTRDRAQSLVFSFAGTSHVVYHIDGALLLMIRLSSTLDCWWISSP